LEAITLANFLNKAKAGELDGHVVFQLWYDFSSSKASKIILSKIQNCEGLVLQLVCARAVALFRLDTSTRSGDVAGARLNLITPSCTEWTKPSVKSVNENLELTLILNQ
jgi:hypothetical protein